MERAKFRGLKASDFLCILESCQMSTVEAIQRIFDQIESTLATLSESIKSMPTNAREEWYVSRNVLLPTVGDNSLSLQTSRTSCYEAVDQAAEANAKSLAQLDGQKSKFREQLVLMTRDDIRHVPASRSKREAVLLSIGGSRRLNNRLPCWELIVIILDGGGVRSYSSILIIKELMDRVNVSIKLTDVELVHYPSMHVCPI